MKMRGKQMLEESCYDLAVRRVEYCFERFDTVAVSFSGGKDSTAVLNIALAAARRAGKTPLHVYTFDEEAIPPETVEYMQRIAASPDIEFRWFCTEVKHKNACSVSDPHWYCWDREKPELWCRPLPPSAITHFDGFERGMDLPTASRLIYDPKRYGIVCHLMGIRTQESITRYRAVASKQGFNAYIRESIRGTALAYPIYDWTTDDVWHAPAAYGWDYNHAYDTMEFAGIPPHGQRCCPPYGEQPIRRLHTYRTCWPDLYDKMIRRVDGVRSAVLYANTELYGYGSGAANMLREGESWQAFTERQLDELGPEAREECDACLASLLSAHKARTRDPVPDDEPHPMSGYSWRVLSQVALIGGDKWHRTFQKIHKKAMGYAAQSGR